MKYYWIYEDAGKDNIRAIGANHIHRTYWEWHLGMSRHDTDKFAKKGFIFKADEGFELFCELRTKHSPLEISERQYNRIVRGDYVKFNEKLIMAVSERIYRYAQPMS